MDRLSAARVCALALFVALVAPIAASAAPLGGAPDPRAATRDDPRSHVGSGRQLAEAVAMITGVPVSPLVGISGLGAWQWWRTPEPLRAALPWYQRPAFWGTGLFLAFLFAANTTIGALLPGLKKPMDFVEHYENQASALLASPIVLVEAHRLATGAFGGGSAAGASSSVPSFASAGVAALAGAPALPLWLQPLAELGAGALALVAFALVFLAFHTIQVLIALSPSTILDLLLRLFRLGVISAAGLLTAVHPYFGALFGLLLLTVALLVAGWSFRLFVFGSVFGRDLLFPRATGPSEPLSGFAGSALGGVPVRSWGRLEGAAGAWRFSWRPWLLLPRRAVAVPAPVALRRGLLSPTLFRPGVLREPAAIRFPPRFKGREEELAARLGVGGVQEGRIVRGLRAAWAWLKALATGRESADLAS